MKLGMEMRQRQFIRCKCCGEPTTEHIPDCPVAQMDKVYYGTRRYWCPECHGTNSPVHVNMADWFECEKCHAMFSTGPCTPVPAEDLKRVHLINLDRDEALDAVLLPEKGTGDFRLKRVMKNLEESKKVWAKELREKSRWR